MIKLVLAEVVQALEGRFRGELPTLSIHSVSIDSRTVQPGQLFFAIPGERFDGHNFVLDALRGGAAAAVVGQARVSALEAQIQAAPDGPLRPLLISVDDPLVALGRLAAYHRKQLHAQVIAVVGSNGKTTTKTMIDHVLGGRRRGRASPKSFNNAVGVPLTLLSAELGDEYLVVEIGTNAPGEIAGLARIVQPDQAIVTSIGEEHLEKLRDLDGVAAEECAVLDFMRPNGFVAMNGDAPQLRAVQPPDGVTLMRYGEDAAADVRLGGVQYADPWLRFTINGRFSYALPVVGAHNALNAAGAITIARRFGCEHPEIADRLRTFALPPMRGEKVLLGEVTLINDAYNANPASARAAIEMLLAMPCRGRRVAVFGEMLELGEQSPALHARTGALLGHSGIDEIFLVGPAVELMGPACLSNGREPGTVQMCASIASCGERLADVVQPGDVVLLKASRGVGLERVLPTLRARLSSPTVA